MTVFAEAPGALQWEATAAHRTLVERDASGARLLKESGPLARLRVTVPVRWAPARLEVSGGAAYGRLDYDGRTQTGAPLATSSRHGEVEAGVRWWPVPLAAWGEASLSLDALWFRRDIAATAVAAGLRETSVLWMPGIGWSGPPWHLAGVPVSAHARWRASIGHRLHIDYGGLFDGSSFGAGRRDELSLGATAAVGRDWALTLGWARSRQRASTVVPIYRAGAVAGTVFQPRIAIDDVSLTIAKRF